MEVFLAYAVFILLMAAPFLVAAGLVSGLLTGITMTIRGLASAQPTTVILGVALSIACTAGLVLGGRWATRGKAGPAALVEISPVTTAMRARPRIFVLGLDSGSRDVLETLSDRFDRIESTRRYASGGPHSRGDRTIDEYSRWLAEWQLVTVTDREALRLGDVTKAVRLTPIVGRSRLPHFGINHRYDPARPNYQFYYFDGTATIMLSRCELEVRLPPALAFLPMGQAAFVSSPTYREAIKRLNACRRTMLERLASDLA